MAANVIRSVTSARNRKTTTPVKSPTSTRITTSHGYNTSSGGSTSSGRVLKSILKTKPKVPRTDAKDVTFDFQNITKSICSFCGKCQRESYSDKSYSCTANFSTSTVKIEDGKTGEWELLHISPVPNKTNPATAAQERATLSGTASLGVLHAKRSPIFGGKTTTTSPTTAIDNRTILIKQQISASNNQTYSLRTATPSYCNCHKQQQQQQQQGKQHQSQQPKNSTPKHIRVYQRNIAFDLPPVAVMPVTQKPKMDYNRNNGFLKNGKTKRVSVA